MISLWATRIIPGKVRFALEAAGPGFTDENGRTSGRLKSFFRKGRLRGLRTGLKKRTAHGRFTAARTYVRRPSPRAGTGAGNFAISPWSGRNPDSPPPGRRPQGQGRARGCGAALDAAFYRKQPGAQGCIYPHALGNGFFFTGAGREVLTSPNLSSNSLRLCHNN